MPSTFIDRIDGISTSTAVKSPVRVATTESITLSGLQTIDGVDVVENDRVLVKDQSNSVDNGIYDVHATSWTRSPDFDGARDAVKGTTVQVIEGTANDHQWFNLDTDNVVEIGTDPITWSLTYMSLTPVSPATESVAGIAEIATQAETNAGTDDARFVTPLKRKVVAASDQQLIPFIWAGTFGGTANALIATLSPAPASLSAPLRIVGVTAAANTGAMTINVNGLGAKSITRLGTTALNAGEISASQIITLIYDGTQFQLETPIFVAPPVAATSVPRRQTVLYGPVDSNGLSSFGGSTGSTTVTATGTLTLTASNGVAITGQIDRVGQIANPSWTGLSTTGTMYLYLDIAADGTCTPVSSTLAPVYQEGGTYSTTNGQFTFNVSEMVGKVGNGSSAVQTYRVCVGQVTVTAGVTSAIVWYALRGRYTSPFTATLPGASTSVSLTHNLGVNTLLPPQVILECTSADNGYAVGDRIQTGTFTTTNSTLMFPGTFWGINTMGFATSTGAGPWIAVPKGGGTGTNLTSASWKYAMIIDRGW